LIGKQGPRERNSIDPATIEPLVTERTKAIYVVHHGGQAVDIDPA
jgi:perosamine synthetase